MQKSLTTSRMQSSCWVNYDRPVSMTLFAAAVRAGPAHTAITCHGQTEVHRHATTLGIHKEAYLPHQPGLVGCMAPRRKPHLCSEARNPHGSLALPLRGPALASARERLAPAKIPADTYTYVSPCGWQKWPSPGNDHGVPTERVCLHCKTLPPAAYVGARHLGPGARPRCPAPEGLRSQLRHSSAELNFYGIAVIITQGRHGGTLASQHAQTLRRTQRQIVSMRSRFDTQRGYAVTFEI